MPPALKIRLYRYGKRYRPALYGAKKTPPCLSEPENPSLLLIGDHSIARPGTGHYEGGKGSSGLRCREVREHIETDHQAIKMQVVGFPHRLPGVPGLSPGSDETIPLFLHTQVKGLGAGRKVL